MVLHVYGDEKNPVIVLLHPMAVTGEKIYDLTLNCNDLVFDVCVNKADLVGEPLLGRRFKGSIWLTGKIDF